MFDQAKMVMQVMKVKKEIESVSYGMEENGIEIDVNGFMAMSEPRIKKLVVNGIENKVLLDALNKALKKATEGSMKKMKDMGDSFKGMM
ncbi:MAG TPA: hypothetical protein PK370_02270 [Candidatus Woesebacteria bacterium]|nr:hypothetical protein [Candidatus Woesebacteria bacterium]HPJ17199.1 hypothetical protein [Candidatus Woesebacteria bacterium]